MIETKVEQISDNEHLVLASVPHSEYTSIYNGRVQALRGKVKMPGFRPGKMPQNVLEQQYAQQLFEDTVSELLKRHYVAAIESSGLQPAMQPELDVPQEQTDGTFTFSLKVVTWPTAALKDVSKLKYEQAEVSVEDTDVQQVVERLLQSQVSYKVEDGRVAEKGDQLTIDFVGSIDDVPFDGGRGEGHKLVLGSNTFIPGFEDQLIGKKAGDHCVVDVTFPEEYQAAHLAGKAAKFDVDVQSVAAAETAEDDDALAKMLNFDSAAALREDAQNRLSREAADASYQSTRDSLFEALLETNEITLPEALLAEDIQNTTKRVLDNMKRQGLQDVSSMASDAEFQAEIRKRSERGLQLSVVLQSMRDLMGGVDISDEAIDEEINRLALQYPEEQRSQFKTWIESQKDQMAAIRDRLTEQACVNYVLANSKPKTVKVSLTEWQNSQDGEMA